MITMVEAFREWCRQEDLRIIDSREISHGVQLIVTDEMAQIPVNFYNTGKALIQGSAGDLKKRISAWVDSRQPAKGGTSQRKKAIGALASETTEPDRIGIDESGKGDYFGPLVICAAYVKAEEDGWLAELGVKDSKLLTPRKAIEQARQLRESIPHETVVIPPKRYNDLERQMRNLNSMLAWGHARSLESLLARVDAGVAISDQFGNRAYLEKALMEKGRKVRLIQQHRAEEDMAVAVASIFARAEFLKRLERMEKEYGMEFPRGASTRVETQAGEFVKKYGADRLPEVAKMHFKTTRKVFALLGVSTLPGIHPPGTGSE